MKNYNYFNNLVGLHAYVKGFFYGKSEYTTFNDGKKHKSSISFLSKKGSFEVICNQEKFKFTPADSDQTDSDFFRMGRNGSVLDIQAMTAGRFYLQLENNGELLYSGAVEKRWFFMKWLLHHQT